MNRCASVRKKGATDPCQSPAIKGCAFCGRHARTRSPVLWASLHTKTPVVRIQSLVRGWLVRKRLALAGPGVLRRKDLANDEDLFTCESKDRQYPSDYFAFEEAGRVWWFDTKSLWAWMCRSLEPVNPYTKTPIPSEVRRRMREIRRLDHLAFDAKTGADMFAQRWNVLGQIFRDNGFIDVHPMQFANFGTPEYRTMFVFLERDIQVVLPERDIYRNDLLRLCRRGHDIANRLLGTSLLLYMLSIPRDPYVLVFSVLSAFYRC